MALALLHKLNMIASSAESLTGDDRGSPVTYGPWEFHFCHAYLLVRVSLGASFRLGVREVRFQVSTKPSVQEMG